MRLRDAVVGSVVAISVMSSIAYAQDLKVGVSWNNKDSSLETAWEDYIKAEGETQGKAAGLNITWTFNVANGDPARQTANIEDLITGGAAVVVARAEDGGAIGASIRAAKEAGVPFVAFDRKSTSAEQPDAFVGGDSTDEATTTTNAFVDILRAKQIQGKCIELQGNLLDSNAVARTKAWNDISSASGIIETVAHVPTEWNPELFRSGLANALKAHPEANCLFTASDFALPAIQAALEDADRWHPTGEDKHMWFASQDLMQDAVKAMKAGYIDVATTWEASNQAKELVRVVIALAKKEDPGCSADGCLAKGRLATPANLDTLDHLWSRDYQ